MTRLRFLTAPPTPEHVSPEGWQREWVGLEVLVDPLYTVGIGHLGEGQARIFDVEKHMYRDPTAHDSMEYIAQRASEYWWLPRRHLVSACSSVTPMKQGILAWLEEPSQVNRQIFAVPKDMVEEVAT